MPFCRKLLSISRTCFISNNRGYLAAVLNEFGKPLKVVTKEHDLNPGGKQVVVNIDSAGVNHSDLRLVRGVHHLKPALPLTPGFELAGTVCRLGRDISQFKEGDRVVALKTTGIGAFAQQCIVNDNELFSIPHTLDFTTAASLPVAYCTAFLALDRISQLKLDNYVLILTDQGSSGLAAIDLAQNVIVATESDTKCATVRPLGVLKTVIHDDEHLVDEVLKITFKQGVDAVIDTVGGRHFHTALRCLKPGGHLLSIGFSSNEIPNVSLLDLHTRRATLSGVWLGGVAYDDHARFQRLLATIIGWYDERYISPYIGAKYGLDNVNACFDHVANKDSLGKVVLEIRDSAQ